jgi:hypothetical protein
METNLDPWNTHDWFDRPLEIDRGEKIIQFICRKCGRGFVNDRTGRRYAIHASVFAVYRLADEVTDRWLSEPCPTEHQTSAQDDEKTRFANGSSLNQYASKSG